MVVEFYLHLNFCLKKKYINLLFVGDVHVHLGKYYSIVNLKLTKHFIGKPYKPTTLTEFQLQPSILPYKEIRKLFSSRSNTSIGQFFMVWVYLEKKKKKKLWSVHLMYNYTSVVHQVSSSVSV